MFQTLWYKHGHYGRCFPINYYRITERGSIFSSNILKTMKIETTKPALLQALRRVQAATGLNTTLATTQFVYIKASPSSTTLETHNGELYMKTTLPDTEVLESGFAIVKHKMLLDWTNGLPSDDITITLSRKNTETSKLQCRAGVAKATMSIIDYRDFPYVDFTPSKTHAISATILNRGLTSTATTRLNLPPKAESLSSNHASALSGCHIKLTQEDIKVEAISLVYGAFYTQKIASVAPTNDDIDVVIPPSLIPILAKQTSNTDETVLLSLNERESRLHLYSNNTELIFNLISNKFPNTDIFYLPPADRQHTLTLNAQDLNKVLRSAKAFCPDKDNYLCLWEDRKNNTLNIKTQHTGEGVYIDSIPLLDIRNHTSSNARFKIAINADQLIRIVDLYKNNPTIQLETHDESKTAIHITAKETFPHSFLITMKVIIEQEEWEELLAYDPEDEDDYFADSP